MFRKSDRDAKMRARQDEIQRITFEVPKEMHAHIKATCARRGTTMTTELMRILRSEFGWDGPDVTRLGNSADNNGDTATT